MQAYSVFYLSVEVGYFLGGWFIWVFFPQKLINSDFLISKLPEVYNYLLNKGIES